MRKWFLDERQELWEWLRLSACDSPEGSEARGFLADFIPWERHIPVSEASLMQWVKERPCHGNSSYGSMCDRDIALAKECNRRSREMLVSFKKEGEAS